MNNQEVKLSGTDPAKGLGMLKGLLLLWDEVQLLKQLHKLGIDPELKYFHALCNRGQFPIFRLKVEKDLKRQDAATAVLFAVQFTRINCFKALVDVGTDLTMKTAARMFMEDFPGTE